MYDFTTRPYMSDIARIGFLQRVILIHSIMYYEIDKTIWTDKQFDEIAKQLVSEMNQTTQERFERTQYYYAMHDFDGTTGFDLYNRLTQKDKNQLMDIITMILKGDD